MLMWNGKRIRVTYKQFLYLDYLSKLKRNEDILEAWGLIWTDENLLQKDQSGLINLFIATIDKVKGADAKPVLVRYLINNLDKVQLDNGEVLDELVRFACRCYTKECNVDGVILDELRALSLALMRIVFEKDDASGLLKNRLFAVYDSLSDKRTQNKIFADLLRFFATSDVDIRTLFRRHAFFNGYIVKSSSAAMKKKTVFGIYNSFFVDSLLAGRDLAYSFSGRIEQITDAIFPTVDVVFWFDALTLEHFGFSEAKSQADFDAVIDEWCGYVRSYGARQQFKSVGKSVDPFSWNKRGHTEEVIKDMLARNRRAEEETARIISVFLPKLSATLIKYAESCTNRTGSGFAFDDEPGRLLVRLSRWAKILQEVAKEKNL